MSSCDTVVADGPPAVTVLNKDFSENLCFYWITAHTLLCVLLVHSLVFFLVMLSLSLKEGTVLTEKAVAAMYMCVGVCVWAAVRVSVCKENKKQMIRGQLVLSLLTLHMLIQVCAVWLQTCFTLILFYNSQQLLRLKFM